MHEAKRYAFEAELPAKRPGGRPRTVPFGAMATQPLNNLTGGPEALVYATPVGDYRPIRRRRRRPDGTRVPLRPLPAELPPGARSQGRPTLDAERAARADVLRALADGEPLTLRPLVRVVHTSTCAVRTIPYKGPIIKWASIDDLVLALASGAF